jgi:choline dehydrogenase-like flavoprotein
MAGDGHFDVIVIGTGAGGGTLAHRLAPSGKRILLLERGEYVPREKDNWSTKAVNLDGKYATQEVWRDAAGRELHPHTNYWVGGNTKFYGAALFRLRREDFGELKHWGGVSPAWPIAYEDLEPYYSEAERLYHVHGQRGEDPTDPAASAPYPYPAVSHEPRIQQLHDDLARLGLAPFHVPLGIMLDERDPRTSRCIRCETCDGHPCLVYAKSDAQVLCVDPALAHPNVKLLTDAYVSRLETSPSGREVTRVVVERGGAAEAYSADIVVVACGAINSAALLFRSANDRHPRGLANGSDVVGRHYMGHVNSVLMAISKCPNPTVFQKTLGLNDFYFGSRDWDYPMGHISFVGKLDGQTLKAGAPAIAPGWTLDLVARHSLDFWLTSEDLPDRGCLADHHPPSRTDRRAGRAGRVRGAASRIQRGAGLRRHTDAGPACVRVVAAAVPGVPQVVVDRFRPGQASRRAEIPARPPRNLRRVQPSRPGSPTPYPFSSRFSSSRNRQSVPCAMIRFGVDLIIPASCRRRP